MKKVRTPGEDYEVPSEYLTDEQFGNMLHEAEKYLNMAYVGAAQVLRQALTVLAL